MSAYSRYSCFVNRQISSRVTWDQPTWRAFWHHCRKKAKFITPSWLSRWLWLHAVVSCSWGKCLLKAWIHINSSLLSFVAALLLRSSWQRGTAVLYSNANWQRCSVWEKVSSALYYTKKICLSSLLNPITLKFSVFQNISSVPGDSSGISCVLSSLLPLLRSHGESSVQRYYWKQRVHQTCVYLTHPRLVEIYSSGAEEGSLSALVLWI